MPLARGAVQQFYPASKSAGLPSVTAASDTVTDLDQVFQGGAADIGPGWAPENDVISLEDEDYESTLRRLQEEEEERLQEEAAQNSQNSSPIPNPSPIVNDVQVEGESPIIPDAQLEGESQNNKEHCT